MQDWWANSTEDCRPFIQKDSLVHIAQLWRGRHTGEDGELQADALSESFRSKDGMETDRKAYGIWVNTQLDRPCILLRGDAVGIGGQTLAEYCSGGTGGGRAGEPFRYAMQEDWFTMGLYVDCVILANIRSQILLSAGAENVFQQALAALLGVDEHKVCLDAVLDGYGRELIYACMHACM
jgi:hypothetical protein